VTWAAFAIGFYLIAAVAMGNVLRARERSAQITFLIVAIAALYLCAHSAIAFAR
jgi:hypothetical protein